MIGSNGGCWHVNGGKPVSCQLISRASDQLPCESYCTYHASCVGYQTRLIQADQPYNDVIHCYVFPSDHSCPPRFTGPQMNSKMPAVSMYDLVSRESIYDEVCYGKKSGKIIQFNRPPQCKKYCTN